ncbi:Protein tyrosine phosphatase type IVA 3 [Phlyctochytrium bullatum]|nr:Protein tyrosine phosphatase type IVA 3 [Phlyctochytrium bullatum]
MPSRTIPFSRVMTSIPYRSMHFVVFDCPTETTLPLYIEELKARNVTDVVRVCEPTYDKGVMEENGISVHDWPFADGSIPPSNVVMGFLGLCDERFPGGIAGAGAQPEHVEGSPVEGPCIAVHCVAGLGRAPVLVAMALIEAGMEPLSAVEFVRRRRRGAFNSVQLSHLVESYKKVWKKPSTASKFFAAPPTGKGRSASPTFARKGSPGPANGEEGTQTVKPKTSFLKVFGSLRKASSGAAV